LTTTAGHPNRRQSERRLLPEELLMMEDWAHPAMCRFVPDATRQPLRDTKQ
jgi:hypothetical protein